MLWICGPGGPLTPGVHYYDTRHHEMRRLLAGDVTPEVRAAVGEPAAGYGQFLVLGVRFWQNSFKYNSFSYHVVTMDTGALLQTCNAALTGFETVSDCIAAESCNLNTGTCNVCTPNARRCVDSNTTATCDANGQSEVFNDCTVLVEECSAGICELILL